MTSGGYARRFALFIRVAGSAAAIALAGTMSISGCGSDDDAGGGTGGTSMGGSAGTTTPFKLKVVATSSSACYAIRCADMEWIGGGTPECNVLRLHPNCACYEGQTRSCDKSFAGFPKPMCSPGSATCGVNFCSVGGMGSTESSSWESACRVWP